MKIELTETEDGSPTLYLPDMDEHYHSVKGAVTESLHVYIRNGLLHRLTQAISGEELTVIEIGFGTGLNVALAAQSQLPENITIRYISLEKYPLNSETVSSLDFGDSVDKSIFNIIHEASWNQPAWIHHRFILEKRITDFLTDRIPDKADVIFMDAFGPDKQPEMWSEESLRHLVEAMKPGAVLTTYCAKGSVRRMFSSLGLTVERLEGPPGGKREILRGTLNS